MRRSISFGLLFILVLALAAGCGKPGGQPNSNRLKVAASFYPLYEFARAVGGDKVDVVNLVPPGTEPHDWEPNASDIKTLNQAALFVYNGAGLEHWVEKTLGSLDAKSLVTVETTRGLQLLEGHDDGEEHKSDANEAFDPHVWLDPQRAIQQVEAIRDGLIRVDAPNKATYEANAAAFVQQLKQLDKEYQTVLTGCSRKAFYTSHAAFGYLANRYGLGQKSIMGLSPDAEPTPKDLVAIVAQARQEKIGYIFFETLVSDKVAKVVAAEVGAKTLVLNPLEGLTDDEVKAGKNYAAIMRENLANLKTALECK